MGHLSRWLSSHFCHFPTLCLTFLGSWSIWESGGSCGSSLGETQITHSVLCSFVEAYKLPKANPRILWGLKSHLEMYYVITHTCYRMVTLFFGCVWLSGILVPWPGIELQPMQWKCWILTTRLPENSQWHFSKSTSDYGISRDVAQTHNLFNLAPPGFPPPPVSKWWHHPTPRPETQEPFLASSISGIDDKNSCYALSLGQTWC